MKRVRFGSEQMLPPMMSSIEFTPDTPLMSQRELTSACFSVARPNELLCSYTPVARASRRGKRGAGAGGGAGAGSNPSEGTSGLGKLVESAPASTPAPATRRKPTTLKHVFSISMFRCDTGYETGMNPV